MLPSEQQRARVEKPRRFQRRDNLFRRVPFTLHLTSSCYVQGRPEITLCVDQFLGSPSHLIHPLLAYWQTQSEKKDIPAASQTRT